MNTTKAIRAELRKLPRGKPFTNARFLKYGSRGTVNRALTRLVAKGEIMRATRGIYARPERSRLVGEAPPSVYDVVKLIAKNNRETLQVHGAEAALLFSLSTQVPLIDVFHTSASSRTLVVCNLTVKMIHTSNRRLLQFAGTTVGLALSALWYVGRDYVNAAVVSQIKSCLTDEDFKRLQSADMPLWMKTALNKPVPKNLYMHRVLRAGLFYC